MKAFFDTTCDFHYGPTNPLGPGVYNSGDCRLVLERVFHTLTPIVAPRTHYLTTFTEVGNGPFLDATVIPNTIDFGFADRIAIPSGAAANYIVLFSELCTPLDGSPRYARIHLTPIP